jgi:hypothetical protein
MDKTYIIEKLQIQLSIKARNVNKHHVFSYQLRQKKIRKTLQE